MQDGILPADNLALDMGCCIGGYTMYMGCCIGGYTMYMGCCMGGYTMYMGCCCSLLTPFACMDSPITVTDRGILNSK